MNEQHFKLGSQRAHAWNIVAGILMGVGMFPVLFMGLGAMQGDHNDLTEWGEVWWPVGLIALLIGAATAIYVKYFYHSQLTLSAQHNAGLQLTIRDPDGSEMGATGTWKWYAYHTRHYAKYGMYRKEQYLVLYTKGRAFVVFRKNFGVMDDPPEVYKLAPGELDVPVAVYRAKDIDTILEIVQTSEGAEQVGAGRNTAD